MYDAFVGRNQYRIEILQSQKLQNYFTHKTFWELTFCSANIHDCVICICLLLNYSSNTVISMYLQKYKYLPREIGFPYF